MPSETLGADGEVVAAVLDASVAVRWLVPEVGSGEASALLSRPVAWFAPRLLVSEVAAALRRKVVGKAMEAQQAAEALDALLQAVEDGTIQLADDERLIAGALALSLTTGHKVPDCLYVALAEREGISLATADLQLGRLAERRKVTTVLLSSG